MIAGLRTVRSMPRLELAVLAAIELLIASMLWQRPFVQMQLGAGVFLIRPWDLAWLVFGALAATLVVRRRGPAVRAALTGSALFYWLFVAAAALSLVWTYATFGQDGFAPSVVRLLRLVGVGLLSVSLVLIADVDVRRILVAGVVAVSLIAAVMALWGLATAGSGGVGGDVTRAGGPFGNFRADGTGANWWTQAAGVNYLGFWLAVSLAVIAGWLSGPGAKSWRAALAGAALAGVLIASLVATHSRESWIAAIAAVGVVLWFQHRPPLRSRWTGFALVALLALVSVVLLLASVRERVFDTFKPGTFSYVSGPQARLEAWEQGWNWAIDRFPIGWGLGAIEEHPRLFGGATAENMLLQAFAQIGLPGLVFLVLFLVTAFETSLRALGESTGDAGCIFAAGFFTAIWVHGIFGNTLGDPTVQVLLGCALGVILRAAPGPGRVEVATAELWRRTRGVLPSRRGRRSDRGYSEQGDPAPARPR